MFDFLDTFKKEAEKMEGVSTSNPPPTYWYHSGNYVLNRILSGNFYNYAPQGRIATISGSSGSGKSYLVANVMREAQKQGAYLVVCDSENALDDEFVSKIGVDPTTNYQYFGVTTINHVVTIVSKFIASYKKAYADKVDNAPKVVIVIDSLDMLLTDAEQANFDAGKQKGDQGAKNKSLKAMLKTFVQSIKGWNISIVCTSQVYANQDILNGEGKWIVSDAVKYSASTITLISKLKLKDAKTSEITGIRMKCEGYKTRFTKPYSSVVIEVPYDTGMDPYSGLLEVAIGLGVVQKKGSRYKLADEEDTWYSTDIATKADRIIAMCSSTEQRILADVADDDIDDSEDPNS